MESKFYGKNKNKNKDDWGFYIRIDVECPYIPKPSNRRDLIIINEKDKLRYYLKKHVPSITQSVILLKTPPQESSHKIFIDNDNDSISYEKDVVASEMRKERISKTMATRTYIILTTILSSTLFAFAFALNNKYKYILKS